MSMTEAGKEEVERHTLWKIRRHSAVCTTLSITDGSQGKWKIPIVSKVLIHQFMKEKLETEEMKMNVGANTFKERWMLQGLLQSTHVICVFELSVNIYRTRFIALLGRILGYCSSMEMYATFDVNSIPIFRYVGTNTSEKSPA